MGMQFFLTLLSTAAIISASAAVAIRGELGSGPIGQGLSCVFDDTISSFQCNHIPNILESSKNSDQCNSVSTEEYNMPLHIAAVFILLVASALGINLPIALHAFKEQKAFKWALFIVQHFGTGVILCTAIVHLIFSAIHKFDDDCLDGLAYKQTPAAIVLAGVYIVFLFDYLGGRFNSRKQAHDEALRKESQNDANCNCDMISVSDSVKKIQYDADSTRTNSEAAMKQLKWEVLLLEGGILFHSIIIGVALSVSTGESFKPYLIALVFHQMFEGMGLGSRISQLSFERWHKLKIFIMSFAFSIDTSLGIIIGIGIKETYSPRSKSALIAIGTITALSAGILLYGSLVELVANDWFRSPEMQYAGRFKTFIGISMLLLGSLLMAVLAYWA
ncbi:hypothetical protein E3P81_02184 [Wallemia ichthyophaga]|nr:hypothetical protein E3P98_01873 [Wallemia ichthyophaga]TIA91179.1 hypothetical protein E3P97_02183 [Wallemia ichthyophaga]TIB01395.1 hypothetical protein E3P94_01776 [Wallemia ichthyophaga]TIB50528.1 hypothetical protein E3P81_02184 [Wallemia ichthyophaga]